MKLTSSGVPLCATTAIPNEPAWPASPEPSSYAHNGVGGRCGMQLPRDLGLRERVLVRLRSGVATTIPAPGSGTGWTYFVSLPPGAALATGIRDAHGNGQSGPRSHAVLQKASPCDRPHLVLPFETGPIQHLYASRGTRSNTAK